MQNKSVMFNRAILREPRKGDPIRAVEYADLVRAVRAIQATDPIPYAQPLPFGILSFFFRLVNVATVRVNAGTFHVDSDLKVNVAQADIALTGDPAWIYLRHEWGTTTASIATKATEPIINSTYYEHPLGKYEAVSGGYVLTDWRWMGGDIILVAPLRGGGA